MVRHAVKAERHGLDGIVAALEQAEKVENVVVTLPTKKRVVEAKKKKTVKSPEVRFNDAVLIARSSQVTREQRITALWTMFELIRSHQVGNKQIATFGALYNGASEARELSAKLALAVSHEFEMNFTG